MPWETETKADKERHEKAGRLGKEKRGRLIRRNSGRSSSTYSFCSVIKKWINEKETHTSANATAINKRRKSLLFRGCWRGSGVRSWRYTHWLLVSLHPFPFSFLSALGSVYRPSSQNTLILLFAGAFPLAFTFSSICRLLASGASMHKSVNACVLLCVLKYKPRYLTRIKR